MLKIIVLCVWSVIVTAGSALVAVKYLPELTKSSEGVPLDLGVEELKGEMTSVPMVRGGEILGYVIIQLSFMLDRAALQDHRLEPMSYLADAAFRVIYGNDQVDFRRLRKSDMDGLLNSIAEEANSRMGVEIVRQVLVQQMNFVKKDEIRTNWIGRGKESAAAAE